MPKWHVYQNSDEFVVAKNQKSKVNVVIPLNYETDYKDSVTGVGVEFARRKQLAEFIAKALSERKNDEKV